MGQSIHAIQVGCENCSGPHLTKDYDLDENGNRKIQASYSSGYRYVGDWRKPKNEWLSYDENKRSKEEKHKQQGRSFYQQDQSDPKQ